ncbi:MAG: phenylacetate--CoA ligase family protein [Pseudonocardia sp.]
MTVTTTVATALRSYQDRLAPRVIRAVRNGEQRVGALRARLASAGVDPHADGLALGDLDDVGVLAKDALPALQKQAPPFGGLVADDADVVRVFASPGPIYEAQLAGPDPWRWAPALAACGIGPEDIVLNCFSYHLSPAGAMFDEACRAIGATVVPAGVGANDAQAAVIVDLGVTAYVGLPSYLASLIEKYDGLGLDRSKWRLVKALVTAEPLPDSLREQLMARVPTVLMAYGTAEAGLLGYEEAPGDGLTVPDDVYLQICDPDTGRPVDGEGSGEVVATLLGADYPLLRFGTGDVSRWQVGADDRLRLAGVLGRVGAAVKVRGMFVHPHQAREVVATLGDFGVQRGRFVVERLADKDVLRLELVTDGTTDEQKLVEAAVAQTREALRVRPEVSLVGSLDEADPLVDARTWPT